MKVSILVFLFSTLSSTPLSSTPLSSTPLSFFFFSFSYPSLISLYIGTSQHIFQRDEPYTIGVSLSVIKEHRERVGVVVGVVSGSWVSTFPSSNHLATPYHTSICAIYLQNGCIMAFNSKNSLNVLIIIPLFESIPGSQLKQLLFNRFIIVVFCNNAFISIKVCDISGNSLHNPIL